MYTLHNPENAANENLKEKISPVLAKDKYPAPGSVEVNAANVQKLTKIAAKKHPRHDPAVPNGGLHQRVQALGSRNFFDNLFFRISKKDLF